MKRIPYSQENNVFGQRFVLWLYQTWRADRVLPIYYGLTENYGISDFRIHRRLIQKDCLRTNLSHPKLRLFPFLFLFRGMSSEKSNRSEVQKPERNAPREISNK